MLQNLFYPLKQHMMVITEAAAGCPPCDVFLLQSDKKDKMKMKLKLGLVSLQIGQLILTLRLQAGSDDYGGWSWPAAILWVQEGGVNWAGHESRWQLFVFLWELGLDIFPKMTINKLVHPCIKIRMVPVRWKNEALETSLSPNVKNISYAIVKNCAVPFVHTVVVIFFTCFFTCKVACVVIFIA